MSLKNIELYVLIDFSMRWIDTTIQVCRLVLVKFVFFYWRTIFKYASKSRLVITWWHHEIEVKKTIIWIIFVCDMNLFFVVWILMLYNKCDTVFLERF